VVSTQDPGERAKQERRRQILAAAKAVFADAGYHGASIHAIIEKSADRARHVLSVLLEQGGRVRLDPRPGDGRAARAHPADRGRGPERAAAAGPAARASHRDARVCRQRSAARDVLLSAGHTPDAEATERLDQFFTEVRDLLSRALSTGVELGLLRRTAPIWSRRRCSHDPRVIELMNPPDRRADRRRGRQRDAAGRVARRAQT